MAKSSSHTITYFSIGRSPRESPGACGSRCLACRGARDVNFSAESGGVPPAADAPPYRLDHLAVEIVPYRALAVQAER